MRYDAAIIGGGPGGYVAAIRAGKLGFRTVLFEREQVGGVCLNRGCIPTKALLKSSGICWEARHSQIHGLAPAKGPVDFAAAVSRKDAVVSRLISGVKGLLKGSGVEVVQAEAHLLPDRKVEAAGTVWEAENVILAMGSRPVRPEGAVHVISSDDLLGMREFPASIGIVGGGVIGVEFAGMLAEFGCGVTVLEQLDRLVPGADRDVSALIRAGLEEKGVRVLCGVTVEAYLPEGIAYRLEGRREVLHCDRNLISTGRQPNFDRKEMEQLGIRCEDGRIKTDPFLETTSRHIYAIGDIAPGPMLAHKASAQGITAVDHIAGRARPMRYDRIPQCVYTHPEAAWVGMSLREADQNADVKTFTFPTAYNGKSLADGGGEGFIRLLSNGRTGEILGAQLVCAHASELIGQVITAMQAEACMEDLAEMISPHPSISEALMEAAGGICGTGIHTMG